MTELLKYAMLARASYMNRVTKSDLEGDLEPVTFVNKDNAQCWVFRDEAELIICFRGTDSLSDAITNVNIIPVDFSCGKNVNCGRVHKGYLDYYNKLREDVMFTVFDHIAKHYHDEHIKLTFVGHSLGGCVLLLALEISFLIDDRKIPMSCYTFGAPALGNKTFCDVFNSRITKVTRTIYDSDIVPRLPIHNHINQPLHLKSYEIPSRNSFFLKYVEHHNMDSYIRGIKHMSAYHGHSHIRVRHIQNHRWITRTMGFH